MKKSIRNLIIASSIIGVSAVAAGTTAGVILSQNHNQMPQVMNNNQDIAINEALIASDIKSEQHKPTIQKVTDAQPIVDTVTPEIVEQVESAPEVAPTPSVAPTNPEVSAPVVQITHSISLEDGLLNRNIHLSNETAKAGDKVTLTAEFKNGETFLDVIVYSASRSVSLGVTKESDTTFTFTLPSETVSVGGSQVKNPFYSTDGSIKIGVVYGQKQLND